jgi:hypothetical protein
MGAIIGNTQNVRIDQIDGLADQDFNRDFSSFSDERRPISARSHSSKRALVIME